MNQKPGIAQGWIELLKLFAMAAVGVAVIVAVLWAFYQLTVAVEALT